MYIAFTLEGTERVNLGGFGRERHFRVETTTQLDHQWRSSRHLRGRTPCQALLTQQLLLHMFK